MSDREPDFSDDALENVDSENLKVEEEDETRFETGADFEDGPDTTDFLGDFETELEKNRARETAPPIKTWESETKFKVEEEEERRDGTDFPGDFKTELEKTHTGETTPQSRHGSRKCSSPSFVRKRKGLLMSISKKTTSSYIGEGNRPQQRITRPTSRAKKTAAM